MVRLGALSGARPIVTGCHAGLRSACRTTQLPVLHGTHRTVLKRNAAVYTSSQALGAAAGGLKPLPLGASSARGASSGRGTKQVTRSSAGSYDALVPLGLDFLTFLAATVLVIPVFKSAKQSPVLGFLFAGVVMGQLGLFRDVEEIEKLSELGVLFLLFEMGLELTIDKLRALAKYAFGLGFLQILVCTVAFTAMALPAGNGIMTQFMIKVLHAPASLAAIRSVDEAVVIAVALSLSSSAFVLQLLKERNELSGQFGQATLGILLAQDIATVPFLVLLPLIEGSGSPLGEGGQAAASLLAQLGPTAAKTLGGLALLLVGGRLFLRRIFELVAGSRSEETFIALCLLSVTGASLLTQRMGFSDTLGAFGAGVLLAETNFKTQVEADIQPFRGILLGLFFVTTGASLDISLLLSEWPIVLTLLVGLLALKIAAISALSPLFGLSKSDSIRTGFVLSQGGEFAFVLLALANRLEILPIELNKLLIIVVVLSMALTPVLTEVGKQAGKWVTAKDGEGIRSDEYWAAEPVPDPVVICGFGDIGQTVANMLESPAARVPYVAFDLSPDRVQAAQDAGFKVIYGEGSRKKVIHAAGISKPRAVAVGYSARQRAVRAVETLRESYPDVPIYARAVDMKHAAELEAAGASVVITAETEAGLSLGSRLAQETLGVQPAAAATLKAVLREDMYARTAKLAQAMERQEERAPTDDSSMELYGQAVYKMDHSKVDWEAAAAATATVSLAAATVPGIPATAVAAAGEQGEAAAAGGGGVGVQSLLATLLPAREGGTAAEEGEQGAAEREDGGQRAASSSAEGVGAGVEGAMAQEGESDGSGAGSSDSRPKAAAAAAKEQVTADSG